jgi:hypothetical protein
MGKTASLANIGTIADSSLGFRNRIINGAMVIDQRNAGASVTPTNSARVYTLDRWAFEVSQNSKLTTQQNAGSVTPPVGFTNYLGVTSSSAYSLLAGDYFILEHKIEGYNTADLAWGTANAKTVTLSFQVYSSLTGTFGGVVTNSAGVRSYPFTYTVSSANTWTSISVTIVGDTAGTWLTTNGTGINIYWGLGVGSTYSGAAGSWAGVSYLSATGATSVVGTSGATFYITGVQLEKGSTATSFDYRPYGTELQLCMGYYYTIKATGSNGFFGSGFCDTSTTANVYTQFPVTMRTAPTALEQSGTASDYAINKTGANVTCSSVPTLSGAEEFATRTLYTVSSGLTAGQGCLSRSLTSNAYLAWSAEL